MHQWRRLIAQKREDKTNNRQTDNRRVYEVTATAGLALKYRICASIKVYLFIKSLDQPKTDFFAQHYEHGFLPVVFPGVVYDMCL